jgi:hypothetical protein
MEKKNLFGLGLLFLALIVIGGGIYYLYTNREEDTLDEITTEDNESPVVEEQVYDNLNLEYDYSGDNTWTYMVTGTLPNPCYDIETEAIVAESYPEQVTIRSIVTPPDEDEICAQVVQEVYEEGEFQASEEASVIFERQ